jgi:hypothetical protein
MAQGKKKKKLVRRRLLRGHEEHVGRIIKEHPIGMVQRGRLLEHDTRKKGPRRNIGVKRYLKIQKLGKIPTRRTPVQTRAIVKKKKKAESPLNRPTTPTLSTSGSSSPPKLAKQPTPPPVLVPPPYPVGYGPGSYPNPIGIGSNILSSPKLPPIPLSPIISPSQQQVVDNIDTQLWLDSQMSGVLAPFETSGIVGAPGELSLIDLSEDSSLLGDINGLMNQPAIDEAGVEQQKVMMDIVQAENTSLLSGEPVAAVPSPPPRANAPTTPTTPTPSPGSIGSGPKSKFHKKAWGEKVKSFFSPPPLTPGASRSPPVQKPPGSK